MSKVASEAIRHAFDSGHLIGYACPRNNQEVTMHGADPDLIADAVTVAVRGR